jgi:hypothetical protein
MHFSVRNTKSARSITAAIFALSLSQAAAQPASFTNKEVAIDFAGPFAVRDQPGATLYPQLLAKPLQTVDFCKWYPAPPEVQQVSRPDRGYLCELHILPAQSERKTFQQVEAAHEAESRKHVRNFRLETVTIGKHRVVRWRFQAGKTRLDHFILIGKKYNYLFVSSPYGSNGSIEEIISKVVLFIN